MSENTLVERAAEAKVHMIAGRTGEAGWVIDQLAITADAHIAALEAALRETVDALDGRRDDLDQAICCSGHDCGCMGSSNRQLLIHDARALLTDGGDDATL